MKISHTPSPISGNSSSSGRGAAPDSGSKPEPSSRLKQDTLQLSNEAEEMAAVEPDRCGNNWRCLEQLNLRGLLA